MTDLPRDDDGKRADPAIAATYKFEPLTPEPTKFQHFGGIRVGSSNPDWDPAGDASFRRHPSDSRFDLERDVTRFGIDALPDASKNRLPPLVPLEAPAESGLSLEQEIERMKPTGPADPEHIGGWAVSKTQAMIDAGEISGVKSSVLRRPDMAAFDGLEPAVTRIGLPIGREINPEFQQRRPRIAGFDRPVDVDFDSALLRQLDEAQRLGAADAASPAGLEAFHQGELARRRAALTDAAFEAGPLAAGDPANRLGVTERVLETENGPVTLHRFAKPVPARHTAPPYSWMADLREESSSEPTESYWDVSERTSAAQARTARICIAVAGLLTVIVLLLMAYLGR